jgi:hypothetical protein
MNRVEKRKGKIASLLPSLREFHGGEFEDFCHLAKAKIRKKNLTLFLYYDIC